jgi:BMFP domain-containing protein YqiC
MEEFRGLTAEMYQAVIAIVDDRFRELRVTREGFERLEAAMARLAEAQARTEARVGRLEEAVASLAEGNGGLTRANGCWPRRRPAPRHGWANWKQP